MNSIYYQQYWIIYPVKYENLNLTNLGWNTHTTQEVIDGTSPLKHDGKGLATAGMLNASIGLSDLWIFPNINFNSTKTLLEYSEIFSKIIKSLVGCMISSQGIITITSDFHYNGPATPFPFTQHAVIHINNEIISNAIDLTHSIIQLEEKSKKSYCAIYDYIVDIRNSPVFISELAMWSFLESRWAYDKKKSAHYSSLSKLLTLVYPDAKDRKKRNSVREKINEIGISLGKEYDEKHLRNMLAHGKHISLQEGWSEEQWNLFFSVHSDLLNLILKGLEIQGNRMSV